jgi:P4 family phage/plasmid primase-like protien
MTSISPVLEEFKKHPLDHFLNDRRAGGKEATMGGMGVKKGTWLIKDDDYPEFLDLLYDYLFVKKMTPMNFVEQSRSDSAKPILIDLDFKYQAHMNMTRKFEDHHIRGFCLQVMEGLKAFYDLSSYENGIRLFVTLRNTPYKDKNGIVKDGIHIESPDFCLSNEKQKALRNWLLEEHAVVGAFEGTEFCNQEEDIYDAAMVRKQGWFFYGESKPTVQPYALAFVFKYDPTSDDLEMEETSNYDDRELMELLSIRYNLVPDDNEVRADALALYQKMLTRKAAGTPVFAPVAAAAAGPPELSLDGGATQLRALDAETQLVVRTMLSSSRGCNPEDLPFIRSLVMECLSEKRCEDYGLWIELGLCLHHIASTGEMSDKLFDLWMDFSRRSPKYNASEENLRKREWNRWSRPLGERVLSMKSLNRWAREDNPTKYKEINDNDVIRFIMDHPMNTHFHIAKVMQKMYGDQYKASLDNKKVDWFMFVPDQHCWRPIKQGFELRGHISNEVVELFEKAKKKLKDEAEKDKDGDFGEKTTKILKEFTAIEKSLYTANFKDSVMKECANLFYDEDFLNKLNLNPYLIVCKNGVLNLRAERTLENGTKEIYVDFRDGRPEDMMSFVAGKEGGREAIAYVPYNSEDPAAKELEDFLNKVYPYPELKEYVITLMSSCLEAMNREQCYYTMTGGGGNGKSKMLELMRVCLGEYQGPLASTVLTRKRPESGAANPDIMSIKNRRFIYLNEPDENEPLNTSRMKQFSGEDLVEARGLFSDQEKFKVCGKLFMLCNNLPPIHAMDRGTWRRIRVIPHPSTFVDENDIGWEKFITGEPNFHRKDTSIDTKVFLWREAYLGLLVKYYTEIYAKNGIKEPKMIKDASSEYKERFDTYAKFRNTRIRKEVGARTDIKLIWKAYRVWTEQQGGIGKKLTVEELRKRLVDEFGAPLENRTFVGIVAFDDDESFAEHEKEHAASR